MFNLLQDWQRAVTTVLMVLKSPMFFGEVHPLFLQHDYHNPAQTCFSVESVRSGVSYCQGHSSFCCSVKYRVLAHQDSIHV